MNTLELLKEEIEKCVRCGTCRSVCPTLKAIGRETACARGRITLVEHRLKGSLELSGNYLRHIKECTLCGACKSNCPNGVDTVRIFAGARAEAVEKEGVPYAASVVFKNLLESNRLPWALKLANRLQGVLFRDAVASSGLLSRFPLPLIGSGRLLPPIAKTPFLELPNVKALSGHGRPGGALGKAVRVAFYAGCGVNYLMPEIGTASLDVLKRAGVEVVVPVGQVCCGMPAYAMGDRATARAMALKNLDIFESCNFDFVTTACATCGHGLKSLFKDMLGDDPELKSRVEAFSKKVRDISELLVNELGFKGKGRGPGHETKVTYHDPCHLGRAQGVREEPRALIASCPGVSLEEMKNPCSCCGLGGGLSLVNYELSMEIAKRKAENIRSSGADVVVTACPGCMVHLRDGLHRFGVNAKVAHVVELL
ncbi:MAG: (Fe-S)-binding protein [Deltaproteobacteria bacterium]|nr:(Fe-S)-binding protein [Deltaproteobacteria bacterium]